MERILSILSIFQNSIVLKSKVVSSYIVAHQEFVTRLLSWIPSLFQISSGFRALFAEVFFESKSRKENLIDYIRGDVNEKQRYCDGAKKAA